MPNPAQEYFDSFAPNYDETTISIAWAAPQSVFDAVVKIGVDRLAPLKILDVGAGTGQLSRLLQEHFPNAMIYGVDGSSDMLALAVKNGNLEAVRAQVANLREAFPYSSNSFDLVVSSGASEYLGKTKKLLEEMARITKAGGYVVSTFRKLCLSNITVHVSNIAQNSLSSQP